MDLRNDTARAHRAEEEVVFADKAHVTTAPSEPVAPPRSAFKRRNAASGEVIDRLKASHPAFASQRPLAIGIRASLAAAHPDIDPRLLHIALSRWCGHPGYLGALIAGGPRYALDGTPCGEVSEEHRAAAVLRLQRPSRAERQSAHPSPPQVPPAVKAKPQRVSQHTNPPTSSASAFSIGTRAILSLKSRRPA